jgi:hypothetical protein
MNTRRRSQNLLLIFLAAICALISGLGYLLASHLIYGLGFPLDDAWIHQTYARNLATLGEWSFLPGKPSAGSTSPLWSSLVAIGPMLRIEPKFWTYTIGILVSALLGILAMKWFSFRRPDKANWAWFVGIALVLEWHISWAAVSGMETLAFALVAMLVLFAIEREDWNPVLVGMVIGIGVWLRPGAITLLFPAMAAALDQNPRRMFTSMLKVGLGFLILALPYLGFNFYLTGAFWPNTFYAKQAEYAILKQIPFPFRYGQQLIQPFIGIGCVLSPGVFAVVFRSLRKREWRPLLPLFWALLYLGTYALQLPVTYQHGRYAIPTIPIIILIGCQGLIEWIEPSSLNGMKRFLSRAWLLSSLATLCGFWIIGAKAYGQDVAIIETEMVAASRWIAENTEETALIAAHDIGALGYYGHRRILDLAGLVSPEVIPIIRDEAALRSFISDQGADYLMTFPNWYLILTKDAKIIYKTEGKFSPDSGGENMAVYQWVR